MQSLLLLAFRHHLSLSYQHVPHRRRVVGRRLLLMAAAVPCPSRRQTASRGTRTTIPAATVVLVDPSNARAFWTRLRSMSPRLGDPAVPVAPPDRCMVEAECRRAVGPTTTFNQDNNKESRSRGYFQRLQFCDNNVLVSGPCCRILEDCEMSKPSVKGFRFCLTRLPLSHK